jgi:hypothetical protein
MGLAGKGFAHNRERTGDSRPRKRGAASDALEVVSPSSEGAARRRTHAAAEQKFPSTPRGHF